MKIKDIFARKTWTVAAVYWGSHYMSYDWVKTYHCIKHKAIRIAKRDIPDGYQIVDIWEASKQRPKRSPIVLIKSIYKKGFWEIHYRKQHGYKVFIGSLVELIKSIKPKEFGKFRLKLVEDYREVEKADWLPF